MFSLENHDLQLLFDSDVINYSLEEIGFYYLEFASENQEIYLKNYTTLASSFLSDKNDLDSFLNSYRNYFINLFNSIDKINLYFKPQLIKEFIVYKEKFKEDKKELINSLFNQKYTEVPSLYQFSKPFFSIYKELFESFYTTLCIAKDKDEFFESSEKTLGIRYVYKQLEMNKENNFFLGLNRNEIFNYFDKVIEPFLEILLYQDKKGKRWREEKRIKEILECPKFLLYRPNIFDDIFSYIKELESLKQVGEIILKTEGLNLLVLRKTLKEIEEWLRQTKNLRREKIHT